MRGWFLSRLRLLFAFALWGRCVPSQGRGLPALYSLMDKGTGVVTAGMLAVSDKGRATHAPTASGATPVVPTYGRCLWLW